MKTLLSRRALRIPFYLLAAVALPLHASNFADGNRWTRTATNGLLPRIGSPLTLTWSIMPDGLQLDSVYTDPATNPTRASRLIVRFDELYNVPVADRVANLTARPWFAEMQTFFDILSSKTGITYVYVSDDGAANGSPGLLGARGDVRIGGTALSGPFAYNATPSDGGDMVINTDGTTFASPFNLRLVFGHEHAHGLGLGHVVVAGSQSLSMVAGFGGNINGAQTDDLQSLLRAYGDVREKSPGDATSANARPLGALPSSTLLTVGTLATDLTVQAAETDFPFSSNSTDVDFFRFSVASARRVAVKLSPQGPAYSYLPEGGTDTNINLSNQADLTLRLQNAGGTQLATSDLIGTGQTEGVAFDLPAAGDYFVRVGNKTAKGQFYRLDIGSIAAFEPAVADHYLADFNTAGDTEGWTASPDVSGFASTGGSLVGTATGNDPFISRQGLFFAGGARRVIFRFRSTGGTAGQFWWTTTNASGFAAERRVDFTYTGDSTWQTIVLDLSANPLWNGQMITGLRVDTSATSGAAFELDQLRVTNNFAYNGDFSVNAASFTTFPGYVGGSNPTNPTGWTTTSSQVGVNGSSAPHGPFAPANSVPSFLFIQGGAPTASQPISTTSGSPYLFGFDTAARNGNTSGVNVFANDTQPASLVLNGFGGNNGWLSSTNFQRYAFGFTATGAQTIQFSGSGVGDHTTDITNVFITDAVSNQLNIADGTLFFTETSGTHNYGFSLTGTNQTIYRRPGSTTYTGNISTDGSAGVLTITANENDGGNNLTFSGSSIALGTKSLNVTGGTVDSTPESLNSKITLTNSTLTTAADVSVGRGSLEITGSTRLTIGGQLRSGAGGDWSTFIMNPGTSVTTTGGVDFTANGVVAANLFLNGGTLTTPFIRGTGLNGNTNLIFNGTTVLASADSVDFLQVRLNAGGNMNGPALIAGGGAIFDTNSKNITIQNTLANDGASQGTLTKQGGGSLTLTGANTYTGLTRVTGGILELSGASSANGGNLQVDGTGAKLSITGGSTTANLVNGDTYVVGGGTMEITGGTLTLQGAVTWFSVGANNIGSGNGTLTISGGTLNANTVFGTTVGANAGVAGTVNINGGTFTANDVANNGLNLGEKGGQGIVNLNSGGTLVVDAIKVATGTPNTGTGIINFNGGTFQSTGDVATVIAAHSGLTVNVLAGGVVVGGASNMTIAQALVNGGGGGGLIKNGSGTLSLTGANTYIGSTTVSAGILQINNLAAINSTSKITVNSGGQIYFDPSTTNGTITAPIELNGVGNGGGALRTYVEGGQLTFSGAITLLDSSTIEGFAGNSTLNFTNAIGGTGNLTFKGVAASPTHKDFMVLSGVSNFNGDLYIENYAASAQVTLSGGDNRLPTTSVVRIGAGKWTQDGGPTPPTSSALDLNGNNQTIAGLSDNGVSSFVGARSVVNTNGTTAILRLNTTADQSFSGTIGGTDINGTAGNNLALVKSGSGTQTLTGVNTYTGDTSVNEGTLAVTGLSIKDTNKLIINGGKVNLTGAETVNALFFGGVQQAAGTYLADAINFTGSGTLIVTSGPVGNFASWAATPAFGLAPGNQGATADPENDGMNNLLEYALNGNPSISDPSILPGLVVTATDFEFTYSRLDLSLADTVQTFQYGSDLSGWTSVLIPAVPGTSTVGVVTVTITNTAATDSVKVSIPKSASAGGKLFGRLRVNK